MTADTLLFGGATLVYLAAFVGYLAGLLFHRPAWARAGGLAARAGFALHTAALLWRWIASHRLGMGHAPLSNLYESLVFFSWTILLFHLIVEGKTRSRAFGAFFVPFAVLFLAYASLSPEIDSRIHPLIPALQSNWLTVHVMTCFFAYACFSVACGLGVMRLFASGSRNRSAPAGHQTKRSSRFPAEAARPAVPASHPAPQTPPNPGAISGNASGMFRREGGGNPRQCLRRNETGGALRPPHLPSPAILEELLYQSVALGFVLLTLGILTGSVWAHYAWGSYWSWDPKETWSLVTWLVYAVILHARFLRRGRGNVLAFLSVFGFLVVLFTYLGVNYLPGLHSYLGS